MNEEQIRHFLLLAAAVVIAFIMLVYGIKTTHRKNPIPESIRQSLPFSAPVQKRGVEALSLSKVTPYPNETEISTLPVITATTREPLSAHTTVTITPQVSFKSKLSRKNTLMTVFLERSLRPNTTYTVEIEDLEKQASYNWSFTTDDTVINSKLLPAITRVQQQMPYSDPNGSFRIFYAPQTDTYFITVHDDERSRPDSENALNWLKSQGFSDPKALQLVITPGDAF